MQAVAKDGISLVGMVIAEVIRDGKHGPEVIQRSVSNNTVINTGKQQTWRMCSGLSAKSWDQMRVGTSPATVLSNQTNLLSPLANTLVTADSKSLLAGTRTFRLIVSYPSGGGSLSAQGIQEVLVCGENSSPGGSAFARALIASVNKTEDDKLKITYQVRIT